MIVRIVKMSFKEECVSDFTAMFEEKKEHIRSFSGCSRLELLRDKHEKNVFFTYSFWDDEKDLENYRHSALFKEVWAYTKSLFNQKPKAWSLLQETVLK